MTFSLDAFPTASFYSKDPVYQFTDQHCDHCISTLSLQISVHVLFDGWEGNMAGYCTSVQPYFHEWQASENTAQEFSPLQRKCEWEAVHTIQWHVSLVGMVRNWQTSCNFICQRSTMWANHWTEYIFCLAFATEVAETPKKIFILTSWITTLRASQLSHSHVDLFLWPGSERYCAYLDRALEWGWV